MNARNQAAAQLASIRAMIAALNVDYDRIEELQNEIEDDELKTELDELTEDADGCKDQDEARERIEQDPLSVEIRSDWYAPGETPAPAEFRILLCTGGPAVQIRGELDDYKQPTRAWLEYQDWGTPWTEYFEEDAGDVLLEYTSQFYFGE